MPAAAASDDPAARCGDGAVDHTEFHTGFDDEHNVNDAKHQRNDPNAGLRRKLPQRVCNECDTQRRHQRAWHNIQCHNSRKPIQPGSGEPQCRPRGADRHYTHHQYHRNYAIAFCVLTVSLFAPVRATENPGTTAIANPVASSTGSVSNQAVQINQGSYSQQSFGGGHVCSSPTLVFTPFYLGSQTPDSQTANYGLQLSFSVPLDQEMAQLCKQLAKRKLEKERLDYEMVRVKNCAEVLKSGFIFAPGSPFSVICGDVVPISAAPKTAPAFHGISEGALHKP